MNSRFCIEKRLPCCAITSTTPEGRDEEPRRAAGLDLAADERGDPERRPRGAQGQGKAALNEAELLSLFQKMIKQRQESAELYDKGGRAGLAAAERAEIEIISAYLPKQMSDVEAGAAISTILHELNAESMKDMGRAMAALQGALRRHHGFQQGQRQDQGTAEREEVTLARSPVSVARALAHECFSRISASHSGGSIITSWSRVVSTWCPARVGLALRQRPVERGLRIFRARGCRSSSPTFSSAPVSLIGCGHRPFGCARQLGVAPRRGPSR